MGYGFQKLPLNVGYHALSSGSFTNEDNNYAEREKQLFLGGSKRILN